MLSSARLLLWFRATALLLQVVLGDKVNDCGGKPAEIVFVLDSSSSIYPEDYAEQIRFVRDVVDIFDIGEDKMRVGAIAFSDDVHPQFDLGSNLDKDSLVAAVDNIKNYGGGTHTDKALKYLRKVALSDDNVRPGVPKIGIVLTDGLSNTPDRTKEEAYLAREEGIIMFVVGIGWGVDEDELAAIGSEPKENFILQIDDFFSLSSIKDKLAIKACKAEEQLKPIHPAVTEISEVIKEACGGKPADVVFALDTSTSIYMEDYHKQLQFVKDVVDMFDVGQDKTRVGLLTFSDDAYPQFSLTSFQSKPALQDAIMNVTYTGGNTFTDLALKFMRETAFQPSNDRPDAVRIGIILTDGLSHDTKATVKQAALTRRNINLFVIGIGPQVDKQELDAIASEPMEEYRFTTDDFDALQSIKKKLAIKACAVEVKPEIMADQSYGGDCLTMAPTDLVFGVDSARFGEATTWHILKFINNLMMSFSIGSEATRVAIVTTSCSQQNDISLSDHFSKTEFQHQLMDFEKGDYSDLMRKVRMSGFSGDKGARNSAAKITLLFLSDQPTDKIALERELKRAKFLGIKVFAIGFGVGLEKELLIELFGEDFGQYFIAADSVTKLEDIHGHLIDMLCGGFIPDFGSVRLAREINLFT
ncbi:collagen alpha-4(VI) chain-like [Liolophura sinensis]|uniref:collagen alpha-4(VI) chain-like n=1 Tax=Liolophura sinensis TaxID=3198878 RepID=UPI00315941E3